MQKLSVRNKKILPLVFTKGNINIKVECCFYNTFSIVTKLLLITL